MRGCSPSIGSYKVASAAIQQSDCRETFVRSAASKISASTRRSLPDAARDAMSGQTSSRNSVSRSSRGNCDVKTSYRLGKSSCLCLRTVAFGKAASRSALASVNSAQNCENEGGVPQRPSVAQRTAFNEGAGLFRCSNHHRSPANASESGDRCNADKVERMFLSINRTCTDASGSGNQPSSCKTQTFTL